MGPILIKIELSKLDKDLFFKGAKGTYADLVLWPDEEGKYDKDFSLQQSCTKEQRAAGKKGPYCGNGLFMNKSERGQNKKVGAGTASDAAAPTEKTDDDCPF
jgi:hypothetical protein